MLCSVLSDVTFIASCSQGLDHEKHVINKALDVVMAKGVEIYSGFVEDPRMTDQAWIETTLMCFHDADNTLAPLPLRPGSNRYGTVKWTPMSEANVVPYHTGFIKTVRSLHTRFSKVTYSPFYL